MREIRFNNPFFMLPKAIVEKLPALSFSELKLLLCLYENAENRGCDLSTAAALCSLSQEELGKTILSLQDKGFISAKREIELYDLSQNFASFHNSAHISTEQTVEPERKTEKVSGTRKPLPKIYSSSEISDLCERDAELKKLYGFAQEKLGRYLSTSDISTLFGFNRWLGLSCDVVCMLISYCVSSGKMSLRAMESTAALWHDSGITTVDAAEEYMNEHQKLSAFSEEVFALAGISKKLTAPEEKLYSKWFTEYGVSPQMVAYAYEETILNVGKYSPKYMDRIIDGWHKTGVKTVEEAKAASENFRGKLFGGKNSRQEEAAGAAKTSIDMEEYQKLSDTLLKQMAEQNSSDT